MRLLTLSAAVALAFAGMTTGAAAKPCRDAKGHFAKCPSAASAPVRCRDAKGHFAKCGGPGVHPA